VGWQDSSVGVEDIKHRDCISTSRSIEDGVLCSGSGMLWIRKERKKERKCSKPNASGFPVTQLEIMNESKNAFVSTLFHTANKPSQFFLLAYNYSLPPSLVNVTTIPLGIASNENSGA
jgi:hypothetical protein